MDPITAALAAGAMAALTGIATDGVRDAYARLRAALGTRWPRIEARVQALEAWPDSTTRQGLLAEDLLAAGADRDAELLLLAWALAATVEREAPQAAFRAGVDLVPLPPPVVREGRGGG